MPISTEGQALLDVAQASTDQTEVTVEAIGNHNAHIAEAAIHIDWTTTGLEQINIDRYIQGVDGADGADGNNGADGADGALNLTQLSYLQRATLRTPGVNPSTDDVVMIPSLGEFQYNATFEFIDDDDTVFEVVDSADGVTPIGQWVMTVPAYDWSEAQKIFSNAVLWEWMEDEELRFNTY
jgi:hypothetical protein